MQMMMRSALSDVLPHYMRDVGGSDGLTGIFALDQVILHTNRTSCRSGLVWPHTDMLKGITRLVDGRLEGGQCQKSDPVRNITFFTRTCE